MDQIWTDGDKFTLEDKGRDEPRYPVGQTARCRPESH